MFYTIRHVTRFTYKEPITESVMEARMQPRSEGPQRCVRFGLSTTPASRVRMYSDPEGNIVHHFNIPGRHTRLTVTAEALVECAPPPDLPDQPAGDGWAQLDRLTASGQFWELLHDSPFASETPLVEAFAHEIGLARTDDPLATVRRTMSEMRARFEYSPRSTRVDSPIDEALEARRGVCQDFAHLQIACLRSLGLPARYVSGYLETSPPPDEPRLVGVDASHAWIALYVPDVGWIDADPTNDRVPVDRHVTLAWGRDYADVSPIRGVIHGGGEQRTRVAVDIVRRG
jgi:transglutaminase-like putative cysteine protease